MTVLKIQNHNQDIRNKRRLFKIAFLIIMISIIITIVTFFLLKDKKEENMNTKETTYTAYVNINPLVKLNFKVSCKGDICDNYVTDYELINDDAKKIFDDIVLKDKSLEDTVLLLGNTVKDEGITFNEVEIYTDYRNEKLFTTQVTEWENKVKIIETSELDNVTNSIEENNLVTKVIFTYISANNMSSGLATNIYAVDPEYGFKGSFDYPRGDCMPAWKFIIKGPKEIMDKIPNTYPVDVDTSNFNNCFDLVDNGYSINYKDFTPYVDLTGLGAGNHKVDIIFESKLTNITALNKTWAEVQIQPLNE